MMTQLFLVGNQSERKYRKEQTCFQCAAAKVVISLVLMTVGRL